MSRDDESELARARRQRERERRARLEAEAIAERTTRELYEAIKDLTERQQLLDHAQRELRESYELVRSQRDALARTQRQKEELMALVVHDLKMPLTNILANVEYAQGQAVPADVREALGDVAVAADLLHRMVLNLLDISRAEEGALRLRRRDIEVDGFLQDVLAASRRHAERRGHTLVIERLAPVALAGDRDMLRRLVENLLDNSIKFAPAASTIRVEVAPRADGQVEIRVRDQGPGVPPEFRERIFERFVQLEPEALADARVSRGLGLAFCRLAAEAHGGRIWVEDNPPRGSCFRVSLPAATPGA